MPVTVSQGKTHTRHCRLLAGGANLSGDSRQLGSAGISYDESDATGWQEIRQYLPGQAALSFGEYNALFNTQTAGTGPTEAGTHTELSGIGAPIATLAIGIQEAPTIGAPAFSAKLEQLSYTVTPTAGDLVMIAAAFTQKAGEGLEAAAWGQLLYNGASISSTTTAGSLDNGASTSAGAYAVLHITPSAGSMGSNSWEIKIQDSPNDSTWSDLVTFTADGSSAGAEWQAVAGTIDRYTRAVLTKSAGTDLIAWINIIRR